MNETTKAVFLSYASQDAEAARRLCETLRAAGVEVWLDADGGLEHGDEWDAKIRRQIKECVLFIPLISAATQARHEGYFRIEWELAAQRALGIASGVAFILPVVIDETREPEALVPDKFRSVQWVRLPKGEMTPEIKARFLKLWSHRTGVLKHEATAPASPALAVAPARSARGRWVLAAASVVILGAGGFWFTRSPNSNLPSPKPNLPSPGAAPAAPVSEAKRLVRQAQELLFTTELRLEQLEIATVLCEKATALDRSDAEVWATASQVASAKLQFGGDISPAVFEEARIKSAQALTLDPSSFEARRARAYYLQQEGRINGNTGAWREAEPILQQLRRERADDPWTLMVLGTVLSTPTIDRVDEAIAAFDAMAALPGRAAVAFNEKAYGLYRRGRFAAADAALDQSIAAEAYTANVSLKIVLASRYRGDLDLARASLAKLPPSVLSQDSGYATAVWTYRWRAEWKELLAMTDRIPRDWIVWGIDGPKSAISGDAHAKLGQLEAARNDWSKALGLVEERLRSAPNNYALLCWKAYLQNALGDAEGSAASLALSRQVTRGASYTIAYDLRNRLSTPDELLTSLESTLQNTPGALAVTTAALRLDPAYENIRGTPRFAELLRRVNQTEAKAK